MNSDAQLTPKSSSDLDCSSSTWLMQERGLKRQHIGTTVVAESCRSKTTETSQNSLQAYSAIFQQNAYSYDCTPGIHFPEMYKTERIEEGQNSVISSMHTVIASEDRAFAVLDYTQNEQQNFELLSTLGPTERLEKRRSKETSPVSNLGPLLELCKQVLGSPGHETTTSKTADTSAKMTTKKRSKRRLNSNSTLKNMHSHYQLVTRSMGNQLTWSPATPSNQTQVSEFDIEDNFKDLDDIPTIQLNVEEFSRNLQEILQKQMELHESDMSKAPPTPSDQIQVSEFDIEDNFKYRDDIPTIQLNTKELSRNLQEILQKQMELQEGDISKAPTTPSDETQVSELDIEDPDGIPTIQFNAEEFTRNLQKILQNQMGRDTSFRT